MSAAIGIRTKSPLIPVNCDCTSEPAEEVKAQCIPDEAFQSIPLKATGKLCICPLAVRQTVPVIVVVILITLTLLMFPEFRVPMTLLPLLMNSMLTLLTLVPIGTRHLVRSRPTPWLSVRLARALLRNVTLTF